MNLDSTIGAYHLLSVVDKNILCLITGNVHAINNNITYHTSVNKHQNHISSIQRSFYY